MGASAALSASGRHAKRRRSARAPPAGPGITTCPARAFPWRRSRERVGSALAVAPTGIPAAVPPLGGSFFEDCSAVVAARRQRRGRTAADADPFVGAAVARGVDHRARCRHRVGVALGPAAGHRPRGRHRAGASGVRRARHRPRRRRGGRRRPPPKWAGVGRAGEHHQDHRRRDQNPHVHLLGNRTSVHQLVSPYQSRAQAFGIGSERGSTPDARGESGEVVGPHREKTTPAGTAAGYGLAIDRLFARSPPVNDESWQCPSLRCEWVDWYQKTPVVIGAVVTASTTRRPRSAKMPLRKWECESMKPRNSWSNWT